MLSSPDRRDGPAATQTLPPCPRWPLLSGPCGLHLVSSIPADRGIFIFFFAPSFFLLGWATSYLLLESTSHDPCNLPPGYCCPCVLFFRQTQQTNTFRVTHLHDEGHLSLLRSPSSSVPLLGQVSVCTSTAVQATRVSTSPPLSMESPAYCSGTYLNSNEEKWDDIT